MQMADRDFYYCADDPFCKDCGGAVGQGQEIRFNIKLSRRFYAYNIFLVMSGAKDIRLKMRWCGFEKGFDVYTALFYADSTGLIKYSFDIDVFGRLYHAGRGKGLCARLNSKDYFRLTVYEKADIPQWIKGSVIYHIFVDRFFRGKDTPVKPYAVMHEKWEGDPLNLPDAYGNYNYDFFGGNLSGITEKLPYLKTLGVGCIYLSPVFEAFSNHKYDTGDYNKIDPMFGDINDFEKLISSAKCQGIKIIIDGVFNHTGSDSIYFNKNGNYDSLGAYQSKNSPYYGWYTFNRFPDDYDSWWGVKTLPAVKKDCDDFQDFIAGENGVLKKWLDKGVNGVRIDVADELSNSFLNKINARCKSCGDILIIGEVWEDASDKTAYGELKEYFWGRQLHSVMNYPFKNALIEFALKGKTDYLSAVLRGNWENYPRGICHSLMNITGTHDTARILTALYKGGREETVNRLKAVSLLQFTVYGVPCVYYGDEAGLEGEADPFNRKPFPWDNIDSEIYSWYCFLGNLRQDNGVFKDGGFKELYSGGGVYIFERYTEKESIITACNFSENPFTFAAENYTDLITGKICGIMTLEKGGFTVLKKIIQPCL